MKLNKKHLMFLPFLLLVLSCGGATAPVIQPEPIPVAIVISEVIPTVEVIPKPPIPIAIKSVEYDLEEMIVTWEMSTESDFKSYTLYRLLNGSDSIKFVNNFTSIEDTAFSLKSFDPTIKNIFYIVIENLSNLETKGQERYNPIESLKPAYSTLFEIEYKSILKIRWSINHDLDFSHYDILRSKDQKMLNGKHVKKIENKTDTMFVIPMDSSYYYQVRTVDKWGLVSLSNIVRGDISISVFDTEFSLIETKVLDLSNKKIFGPIPIGIGGLFNLSILRLNNNFFTGPIPESIYDLKQLKVLNLSHNTLSGELSPKIYQLAQLEELWIGDNQLSGVIPYQLGKLSSLKYLNFSNNQFSGHIPESIVGLENLRYFNGWKNNLTGFLPAEFGELKKLEFLSLGDNQITGEIPPELGNAKKLKSIGLFENQLIGKIPQEISFLLELDYLGLFSNNLEGEIPDHLFKKGSLSYLKLNNNNLDEIDHDLICKSGYNWENSVLFDISKNNLPVYNTECIHSSSFHEIYHSY